MTSKQQEKWKTIANAEIVKKKNLGYRSITSIINARPNRSLEKWREELGEDVADFESNRCAKRGLKVHSMIQEYFTTEFKHLYNAKEKMIPSSHRCDSVLANGLFINMLGYLEMINNIVFIETELYSDKYKIHGRVDCIAKVYSDKYRIKGYDFEEGYLAVIDFKTSNTPKQSIKDNYGVQLCAYAVMYNEMFNENIKDIVLINADETGGSQMIRREVKKFMPTFEEWVNEKK